MYSKTSKTSAKKLFSKESKNSGWLNDTIGYNTEHSWIWQGTKACNRYLLVVRLFCMCVGELRAYEILFFLRSS